MVLVRYPFTNITDTKVRPAVVLTPDHLMRRLDDVLGLFASSAMPADLLPTDFILEPGHSSFPGNGLKCRSVSRTHKLALLDRSPVLARFKVTMDRMNEIEERLRIALGL